MKKDTLIPTLIQYRNNRLSPTEVQQVLEWLQAHPEGNTLIRGLDILLQQENRNEARILHRLNLSKRLMSNKLFGEKNFG